MSSALLSKKVIGLPESVQLQQHSRHMERMEEACGLLLRELQRSLDLAEILNAYVRVVSSVVSFESLSFSPDNQSPLYTYGEVARFRVAYALEFGSDNPGEIVFSRTRAFEEDELMALEQTLACLGYPLRNAMIYRNAVQAARLDGLTGVGNRAALDQTLATETALASRYGSEMTLLIVDVDHFKYINDNFGHVSGDEVLKALAERLSQMTRKTDDVYRFGGEEFVILLRNTTEKSATILAERIRRAVECAPVRCGERNINATISVGLAGFRSGMNAGQLLETADSALYRAKKEGRNRVCIAA